MIAREILPSLWMSALLVISSLWMMQSHVRSWRAAQTDKSREAHELNFRRRQFRRRMQTSGILGLLGISILAGHFIKSPMLVAVYWGTLLLAVAWLVVLACFDAISTHLYFRRMRRRNESQKALLELKLQNTRQKALAEEGDARLGPGPTDQRKD